MTLNPRYPIQFYLNESEYARYKLIEAQKWTQKELFLDGVEHKIELTQKAKDLIKETDETN